MSNLFTELKRRNVVRVGIAYVIFAWVAMQVIDVVVEPLLLPEWTATLVIVILLIGLPLVLFLSWAYELTPEGVKKTEEVDKDASITPSTGRRLDRMIIGALVVAVAMLAYDRVAGPPRTSAPDEPQSTESKPDATPAAEAASIAVLPFVNMSSDAEQEYFSDGITEELLNTLAKVPGLLVAARTSVFSYKGQSKDVREIGRELGVTNIVEGSVRKAGNDLRITAQLIRVSDGFHLWSETYDRRLENVFAIQEEIAFAIADALKAPLGLEAGGLVTSRTRNMAAYDLYLKGLGQLKQRGPGLADAVVSLRQSLALDADFAPAWAALAITYQVLPTYVVIFEGKRPQYHEFNDLSEEAAARALALDPGTALAHQAMGSVHRQNYRWPQAEDEYLKALAIDPQSASVLEDYNEFLDLVGLWNKSIEYGLLTARLEPFRPVFQLAPAWSYLSANNLDKAEEFADRALAVDPTFSSAILLKAEIRVLEGEYAAALKLVNSCPDCVMLDRELLIAALTRLLEGKGPPDNPEAYYRIGWPSVIHALFGKGELFKAMEFAANQGIQVSGFTQFGFPFMNEMRTDPRYKAFVDKLGLVDYWRARGWPPYCWPRGDNDFECGAPK